MAAHLLSGLPGFLRRPFSVSEAQAVLRRRLERREVDFLELVDRAVYRHPTSPYRRLLRLAGCEIGDLRRLLSAEGLEGALRALFLAGVYLTVDEFKGRRPAVRGSATLPIDPARLRNPGAAAHVATQTGGSRGASSFFSLDLAYIRERGVDECLWLESRGGLGWRQARWGPPASLISLLRYRAFGRPTARWFLDLDAGAAGLPPRYRWSARLLRWGSLLAGVPLPAPSYVPPDDPLPIAAWMGQVLREGSIPCLQTHGSSAVRVCLAAREAGLDLGGAQFTVMSEPLTAARLAVFRQVGAGVGLDYGSVDAGDIGRGCLAPAAPDDVHWLHDMLGLIQPGHRPSAPAGSLPPRALLFTSLRARTPIVLLNVSLGDQAELERRSCGCPLEQLGWTTHLNSIRSFEKLTAAGMTFLDSDVIRILEEDLPARFGGGPTQYQLVEDEALEDGRPRLRLLVHPAVGPLDEQLVAETFLEAIGRDSDAARAMALHWRRVDLLRVERRPPLTTASGKILHLHQTAQPAVPLPS